ncbi:LOW QUALITY PROTEIN: hypothetical protein PHMEG_0006905 [Phytophthora megakarya]|uniref:Uncharacterized protein n=1 Tax=Phytophthora megakarya TaxID=4795 RepID=A0A225WMR4_9STRA|nr:LOW QUALITY PROTEIN: hypothetical protein PHMEG_0006905 [Phytophthora megakarya]
MLGDVAGGFRHVPMNAEHAHMFAFIIDEFLVIDLACGFGWCGSPDWYYIPGALINGLYELSLFQRTLANVGFTDRFGVTSTHNPTLGPVASLPISRFVERWLQYLAKQQPMNENSKSSTSHFQGFYIWLGDKKVGIEFTRQPTPHCPLLPTCQSLFPVYSLPRDFYEPQHGRITGVPVEQFAHDFNPSVHVHMDASNEGLCVVVPSLHQYIQVKFTQMDQKQSIADPTLNFINVRERQSAVLAGLIWGSTRATAPHSRRPTHVCFWIDNASAVAWAQRRSSRHPLAQLYNRLLSLAEFNYGLSCTAEHIPGCDTPLRTPIILATAVPVLQVHELVAMATTRRSRLKSKVDWNGKGNKFQTIQLKVSSIRWFHRLFLQFEPSLSSDFEVLMRGIQHTSEPIQKKHPVTPAFLRLMSRLLWGSVLLAYFYFTTPYPYCIKTVNSYFSDQHGQTTSFRTATSVTIGLSGSKNDQFGWGARRTMHITGEPVLCPVKALWHILQARRALGLLSSKYLCADLNVIEVNRALKMVAASLGVPRANYSTHSIFIGGASALLKGDADSLSIKLLGRWAGNCFEDYPVQAARSTIGLSNHML